MAPQLVFTHTPSDYMMDHVMASLLARAASFVYGAPNISTFPLREGSCVPHLYYCDPLEGIDPLGKPVEPTTLVDITASWRRRPRCSPATPASASGCGPITAPTSTSTPCGGTRQMRGREAGVAAAEAFVQHRGHAYPRTICWRNCSAEE